jgi:hypothetical protein
VDVSVHGPKPARSSSIVLIGAAAFLPYPPGICISTACWVLSCPPRSSAANQPLLPSPFPHTRTIPFYPFSPVQLDPTALLPLLFRMFSINDKALRELLFRHIVAGEG